MDRKKLANNLIIVSILLLAPVFFISWEFTIHMQALIYTFAGIAILLLVVGLIYVRKDLKVQSTRFGLSSARTPLGVGIALILSGIIFYYMLGYGELDVTVPPQAIVQATLVLILALSSAIIAVVAAIVYKPPTKKRSSTWT